MPKLTRCAGRSTTNAAPDRVEDITQALRGTKVSPGTVSNLNQKVYDRIEQW